MEEQTTIIEREPYDVIVIGAGAAGMMAAGTAARSGKRVLLIEKMEKFDFPKGELMNRFALTDDLVGPFTGIEKLVLFVYHVAEVIGS